MKLTINAHYQYEYFCPKMTVTGTAAVLPTAASPVVKPENIFVQAHPANTKNIIIGKSTVTANLANGGYILAPGSNMNLPGGRNATTYYAIAESAGTTDLMVTYQRGPM